jgi:hypothetical protein
MTRVSINHGEIARMMRDIQREFDKHRIAIPITTEGPELPTGTTLGGTHVYNGPVIQGDANGAQLAWGNHTVHQTQNRAEQISPGFEAVTQAVVSLLEQLPAAGLAEDDQQDAEEAANEVLTEVTQPEPDRKKIRRALSSLKGLLAPLATGMASGAGEGVHEWAKTAIEQLGTPF